MSQSYTFQYKTFRDAAELEPAVSALLAAARQATALAYAPYSGFKVGAALRLSGGHIVRGANQENASYPAGICAERAALAAAASLYPGVAVEAIAITYDNTRQPGNGNLILSPCGICRQSLLEKAQQQGSEYAVIMSSMTGEGILMDKVSDLLPFAFSGDHLH